MFLRTESFSRGYDHGNYGNAYESQDWETWSADQETPEGLDAQEYAHGMLLGFFSSFEAHEIGDEMLAQEVSYLRERYSLDQDT